MNNPFTLTFGREPINRIDRLEQKEYVNIGVQGVQTR